MKYVCLLPPFNHSCHSRTSAVFFNILYFFAFMFKFSVEVVHHGHICCFDDQIGSENRFEFAVVQSHRHRLP